jgi:hypothetical protein
MEINFSKFKKWLPDEIHFHWNFFWHKPYKFAGEFNPVTESFLIEYYGHRKFIIWNLIFWELQFIWKE